MKYLRHILNIFLLFITLPCRAAGLILAVRMPVGYNKLTQEFVYLHRWFDFTGLIYEALDLLPEDEDGVSAPVTLVVIDLKKIDKEKVKIYKSFDEFVDENCKLELK
jgi:hypothetical protein